MVKKISFLNILLVFLILAIIGISIFLFFLLRRPPSNSKNTPLFIPVISVSGTVNEIKENSIYFTPNAQSLSLLNKDGSSSSNTYEAKVNSNTIINKIYFPVPYISPKRKTGAIIKNIVFGDVHLNDSVTIESATEPAQKSIVAGTITINSNPFFIPGRIENIQDGYIEIVSPPSVENPTEEVIKKLNIRSLQILITPETEISYTSASQSAIITKNELTIKDIVFIHTFNNPDVDKTITAEMINVQRFAP